MLHDIPPPGFISDVIPRRRSLRALISGLTPHSLPVLIWYTLVCSLWVTPKSSFPCQHFYFMLHSQVIVGAPHSDSWTPIAFWHTKPALLDCWITAFSYWAGSSLPSFPLLNFWRESEVSQILYYGNPVWDTSTAKGKLCFTWNVRMMLKIIRY